MFFRIVRLAETFTTIGTTNMSKYMYVCLTILPMLNNVVVIFNNIIYTYLNGILT